MTQRLSQCGTMGSEEASPVALSLMQGQRIEHRAGRAQIYCFKAFREPVVDRRQYLSRVVSTTLDHSQASKAESNPQFPKQGARFTGQFARPFITIFRQRRPIRALLKQTPRP